MQQELQLSPRFYFWASKLVSIIHLLVILINVLAVPFLIVYQPLYISIPIMTMILSPLNGGTHCWMNQLENEYRIKAGRPQIKDRLEALAKGDI